MTDARMVDLTGGAVEVVEYRAAPGREDLAPLVFLHEGLGSAGLWRGFPTDLASRTGRRAVVWSRHGHGRSAPAQLPRPPSYMHHEAHVVLPELLVALGVEVPLLVGHSDGASIAFLHAGGGNPVAGIVGIAPHVLVEERSLAGVREARERYVATDLRERLGRHHADPDATFWGWNDAWLAPGFRRWNIEAYLPAVDAAVLVVQAADDAYGTLDQVDRIAAGLSGRFERLVLPAGGHAPHQTHRRAVLDAAAAFVADLP